MSVVQLPRLEPVPRTQYLPLSFSQQRLWFLDQLEPDSPLYNIRLNLRLRGRLNFQALEQSFVELMRRHEVLRTNFRFVDGEPVQVIRPAEPVTVSVIDLSGLPESQRDSEEVRLSQAEHWRPFNLEHDSLMRVLLLRLSEDDHIMLITVHHIIFDGWSDGLLRNELTALYNAFDKGGPSPLPDQRIQYADFAAWQRKCLQSGQLDKHLAYWKQHLAGSSTLELPTDHVRPPLQTFRGMDDARTLPKTLLDRLKQLSRREDSTLFMTLLATLNVLLFRYTDQEDVIIGTAVAGRNWPEVETLFGCFINTLVLRTALSGDPTFEQLLNRVREVAIDAFEHQDVPFEKLVEELKPDRNTGRNPLFQVMLNLQNLSRQSWRLSDLIVEHRGMADHVAKFDLTITMSEQFDGLRVHVSYNADLFDAATIARTLEHFENLAQSLVANPAEHISRLPLLSAAERHRLLVELNDTRRAYPNVCVHELFETQVDLRPDATALVLDDRQMTYGELDRRANHLAKQLREMGIRPDTLVGVCMGRSIEMMIGFLGILKAGGAYLPLDPAHPSERLSYMVRNARMSLILTLPDSPAALPADVAHLTLDANCEIQAADRERLKSGVTPANLAYVMYTSGSTGIPKGVEALHRGVVRLLFEGGFGQLDENDVYLHYTNPSFDASTLEIWGALLHGGQCILFPDKISSSNALRDAIDRNKVNVLWMTTPLFNAIVDESPETLAGIRQLYVGGEALSVAHISRALEALPETDLINSYGPTENTVFTSTYHVPRHLSARTSSIPIGRPIGNTQIYVLDRNKNPVPIGVVGELYVGGDGLARGYLNQPELTREKFVPSPLPETSGTFLYRTGDLVRHLPDGNIDFLGRVDNQVKIRGYRIELGEIENSLVSCPFVKEAVAMVREDVPGRKCLVAYVVPITGREVPPAQLRSHLKQRLPDYMVPEKYVCIPGLPLTSNGKVDRRALPAPKSGPEDGNGTVLPRNDVEAAVLKAWQRVLRLDSIGVTDNFFDRGGHSLLAVRLMAEIEKVTGALLPVATLFEGATVEYLASALVQPGMHHQKIIVEIQRGNSRPPFFGIVTPGVNALGYVALGRHLGEDQPLYRIQGVRPRPIGRPYSALEFETIAAEYIEAMKTAQPRGPYCFGGMCEGARIAFDMARLLEAQGDKIGLLAIFDTWVIENSQYRLLSQIPYYSRRLKSFWHGTRQEKWQTLLTWVQYRFGANRPPNLLAAAYWPGQDFVPAKCTGKITVFKIPKQPFYRIRDPFLGWGSRTTGGVELISVDSRHMDLLREPYVHRLAEKLADSLGRVGSRSGDYGSERVRDLIDGT